MSGCAYYEGYWTALDGIGEDANPYEQYRELTEWMNWRDGWADAHDERRISER